MYFLAHAFNKTLIYLLLEHKGKHKLHVRGPECEDL